MFLNTLLLTWFVNGNLGWGMFLEYVSYEAFPVLNFMISIGPLVMNPTSPFSFEFARFLLLLKSCCEPSQRAWNNNISPLTSLMVAYQK